jgi:GTP-binding protein Era
MNEHKGEFLTNQPFHSGFAAIVGRPNVGKSTLLNAILGEKIVITSDKPQTTRNRIQGIHNIPSGQIVFVDTPGVHRAKSKLNRSLVDTAMEAIQGVDVILFLVEANAPPPSEKEMIDELLAGVTTPVFLIINKVDLVDKGRLLQAIETYNTLFGRLFQYRLRKVMVSSVLLKLSAAIFPSVRPISPMIFLLISRSVLSLRRWSGRRSSG